jgi:hypothetical protein
MDAALPKGSERNYAGLLLALASYGQGPSEFGNPPFITSGDKFRSAAAYFLRAQASFAWVESVGRDNAYHLGREEEVSGRVSEGS